MSVPNTRYNQAVMVAWHNAQQQQRANGESVSVPPANVIPTLTAFSAVIDTTVEDTEVELTFAELNAQGDEADSDGAVDAYVVQAVSTGTLKIGSDAGSATSYAADTNDTIDATNNAYWTPTSSATGTLNAFTVKAQDDDGALSETAVQAQVEVTASAPTQADFDTHLTARAGASDATVASAAALNTVFTANTSPTLFRLTLTADHTGTMWGSPYGEWATHDSSLVQFLNHAVESAGVFDALRGGGASDILVEVVYATGQTPVAVDRNGYLSNSYSAYNSYKCTEITYWDDAQGMAITADPFAESAYSEYTW